MKTKIYKTLIFAQCLFALSIAVQAQFPNFTRIDTGAVYESTGAHFAGGWFDMDRDGDMDLIIVNAGMYYRNHPNLLYQNERNGRFVQINHGEYPNTPIWTALPGPIGDIDNDGDEDLILSGFNFHNFAYRNDKYGNLIKDSLYLSPNLGSTPFLLDLNNDSFLDLLRIADNSFASFNDGTGKFSAPDNLNISNDPNFVLHGASWGDADDDGDFDLFCGYSYWEFGPSYAINALYLNDGNENFEKYNDTSGYFTDSAMTPCVNWIDYDNDGDMDLFVLNSWIYADSASHHGRLYINNGNLQFEKYIFEPEIYKDSHKNSSAWGDLDNDGDLDLYITIEKNDFGNGGHQSPTKVNLLFENDGAGQMTEITDHSLVEESSHGITLTDHDNDGDLDVLLIRYSWSNDGHNNFFINEGNDNSWVILTCEGTLSNRTAIGTRIITKATIDGQPVLQTREITPLHGHYTYPSLRVHFGLGDADVIDTLIFRWPSGHVDEYLNVKANQFYRAIEDSELGIDFKATNYIQYSPGIADLYFEEVGENTTIDLKEHYHFMKGDTVPEIIGDTLTFSVYNNENPGVVHTEMNGSILTLEADTIGETIIQIIASAGFTERMDQFEVKVGVGLAEHKLSNPVLISASPNPFTNEVTITYEIPAKSKVKLEIYNYCGQLVSILINEEMQQGKHEILFEGMELPPGIYFCVLKTNEGIQTRKIIKL